jgi:hypothetical protein
MSKPNVWFTGAQGTGKTTQLEQFLKAHPDYNQVEFQRRKLADDGVIRINRDATIIDEAAILFDVGNSMRVAQLPCISDRCWTDKCAYSQALPESEHVRAALDVLNIACFKEIKHLVMPPNIVVYFPPVIDLVADSNRDGDKEYQALIDWWIQYYLTTLGIPYYTLDSISIGDRTMEIEQVVWGKL